MPIQVTCSSCRGVFNAPDAAAGKRAKCPTCGGPIQIPTPAPAEEILEAEPIAAGPYSDDDFDVEPPPALPEVGDLKPCPMCGEKIQRKALKCRFCGEVFDPVLKQAEAQGAPESANIKQDKSNAIALFVTGLLGCFSPIALIFGIVFLVRRPYQFPLKWMAIVGTILHGLWTGLLVLSIASGNFAQ